MTLDEAIENAVRILQGAESQTDLALLERLGALADSWIFIAQILMDRE